MGSRVILFFVRIPNWILFYVVDSRAEIMRWSQGDPNLILPICQLMLRPILSNILTFTYPRIPPHTDPILDCCNKCRRGVTQFHFILPAHETLFDRMEENDKRMYVLQKMLTRLTKIWSRWEFWWDDKEQRLKLDTSEWRNEFFDFAFTIISCH